MPFIFYDFETTGLSKQFDQFVQFGAVFADDDLNELDSLNIRCRRLPHIIPSPVAMRLTRNEPADLEECELSHYDATNVILDWCQSKGPCIYAGHNSMSFDEDFLRQALYQNLHEPFLTNTNGNSRADILLIAQCFFHHAPGVLEVPPGVGGRFVLRLGQLARANGIELSEEDAHDALADVRATVGVASVMKNGSPELWDHMIGFSSRHGVDEFLASEDRFFASFFFGGRPFSYVVTEVARSAEDDKEIALFDLTHDPINYIALSRDDLVEVLNSTPKVIRTIRSNKQPTLVPLARQSDYLRGDMPSAEVLTHRVQQLQEADEFRARLAEALPLRYEPFEQSDHVEERIYDGFPDDANKALMVRFHLTELEQRHQVVENFTDERFRELGNRLLCAQDERLVSDDGRATYRAWLQRRHHEEMDSGWRTVDEALREIDDIERENPADAEGYERLREYITSIAVEPA